MDKHLQLPLDTETIRALRVGERVFLTGALYTARDDAHQRMDHMLDRGETLPVDLTKNALYYAGPAPAAPGRVIGAVGPTTAGRMDPYTPRLIREGLRVMIGKGLRSDAVLNAIRDHGCVYFAATGGTGALLARCVKKAEVIAFDDLGPEAIHRLEVVDFPVTVAIDSRGECIYSSSLDKEK